MRHAVLLLAAALAVSAPTLARSQEMSARITSEASGGVLTMVMPGSDAAPDRIVTEALTFEPLAVMDAFGRDDIVLLMRHGPTDWSKRDETDVAPDDCANQRVMTETGKRQMYELGALLVAAGLAPGRIVVSRWCRNQQTLDALGAGMRAANPTALDGIDGIDVETETDLNLLLSLQGAANVSGLRRLVSEWDGGSAKGPLLVISHFTNIEELTERSVFEGEMLVLDPKRDSRVLGELRLDSAGPDVGHFQ